MGPYPQDAVTFRAEDELDEVLVNDEIAKLFQSKAMKFIHSARHGKPQDQVMAELKRDIDQATGALKNQENWVPELSSDPGEQTHLAQELGCPN